MNAHAVHVEAAYRRPIMSAFHAMFSIGGVFAALLGARTLSWGWRPTTTLTGVAVAALVIAVLGAPSLLPQPVVTATRHRDDGPRPRRRRTIPPRIWALAAAAFMLMLSEGVAADWSALSMRDVLDTSPATAAFAYGGFAMAMTAGRFLTDRVAARVGSAAVVRYGSAFAALALALIVWSPSVPLAIVGWTLFGVGLSGTIPQLFSAAGHAEPANAATNVSRVAGLGYLGMLAGPAAIGLLTRAVALNYTFLLPLTFCAVAALTAPMLLAAPAVEPVVEPGADPAVEPASDGLPNAVGSAT